MSWQSLQEKFVYLDDIGQKLPALILAVKADVGDDGEERHSYKFSNTRHFFSIAHQAGGLACNQVYLYGTILSPTPKTAEAMRVISDHWFESNCGVFGVTLDELLVYRAQLQLLLGENCNESYEDFQEGVYPIDITGTTLGRVCEDALPADLDDLVEFESGLHRLAGFLRRWRLFVLAINSD